MINLEEVLKELEVLQTKIDEVVEWNFGYCPNTEGFNKLLVDRKSLEDKLKDISAEHYELHINNTY